MGEEWVNRRPVAVMLNNLKEALPQLGQSSADIIYEVQMCIRDSRPTFRLSVPAWR